MVNIRGADIHIFFEESEGFFDHTGGPLLTTAATVRIEQASRKQRVGKASFHVFDNMSQDGSHVAVDRPYYLDRTHFSVETSRER